MAIYRGLQGGESVDGEVNGVSIISYRPEAGFTRARGTMEAHGRGGNQAWDKPQRYISLFRLPTGAGHPGSESGACFRTNRPSQLPPLHLHRFPYLWA